MKIQKKIEANAAPPKSQAAQTVREGSALLQGIATCGKCGRSMHIAYHGQGQKSYPYYQCNMASRNHGEKHCQSIGGRRIDHAVAAIFLEAVSPAGLKIQLKALEKLQNQEDTALKQLELQLERAEYEAERAYRQFDSVEPENRLVARTLEQKWNEALGRANDLKCQLFERQQHLRKQLSKIEKQEILHLSRDLKSLWNASSTTDKDRKKLLRSAIAEVQLLKEDRDVAVKIIWAGGATTDTSVHLPKVRSKRHTSLDVVDLVRQLAQRFTDDQIARILIRQGHKTATGLAYNAHKVANLRYNYGIPRYKKPKNVPSTTYTAQQAAQILQVSVPTVHSWLKAGFIKGEQLTEGAPWEIILTEEDIQRLTVQDSPEGWLPIDQAAKRLNVSKQTVLNWVKSNKLEYIYVTKGKKKGLRINTKTVGYLNQFPLLK